MVALVGFEVFSRRSANETRQAQRVRAKRNLDSAENCAGLVRPIENRNILKSSRRMSFPMVADPPRLDEVE